jgi:Recombination endonuclease VII
MPYKDPTKAKESSQKRRQRFMEKNPEYYTKYEETYKVKPEVIERRRLQAVKRYYNLDAEQYLQMILDQNNCCAICNQPETHKNRNGDVRPLNVDHCHKTGKVRALLCTHCNSMLGQAFDKVERLQKGIDYLNKHLET